MVQENKEFAKYVPQLKGRRWITKVCDGGVSKFKPNGGLHSQEKFKEGIAMLENAAHAWRNPRLYHFCLTGASVPQYAALLASFKRMAERQGIRVEYKTCVELDDKKALHLHAMVVTDTGDKMPSRYITTSKEEGVDKPTLLRKAIRKAQVDCPGLVLWVCRPASGDTAYIQFNQTNNELLNDACEYLSYLYKARSKPTSGEIYSGSRSRRKPVHYGYT